MKYLVKHVHTKVFTNILDEKDLRKHLLIDGSENYIVWPVGTEITVEFENVMILDRQLIRKPV